MKQRKGLFITSFLVLPVALYAIMVISPFLQAFYYSMTNWTGTNPNYKFVGLDNFKRLFTNELYSVYLIPALKHNAFLLIAMPVIVIALALFFAFMLNVGGRSRGSRIRGVGGSKFYKIVFFFPQVLSVTVVGVLWGAIFRSDEYGFLNSILALVGIPTKPSGWLSDPDIVLLLVMLVMIWSSVGFYLVYFSAAMSSIPTEIYEASMLDGASRVQTFFKVTLPLLFESVQTAWIYLGIIALDAFALVFVMTPEQGGPNHSSEVLGGVMYHYFSSSKAAVACAVGVVLFFFTLTLVMVSLRATRRERVEY
ncbi:carbohydrate ABC transporter permease [Phytomonospora endophytica]|uniref:N-acetylglucosamine transport system permease protein n=1 Tax=Phytomonospora endophytica TaxID=714109 RepID=A0A841FJ27_9ACTN|nr:sugar ABC transporter permease [Phytomonospora endophytica]MBB6033838.1 N-acetylglucosamine transport system permease protein [Phytomonospora endophytica]GIG64643.1 sugar ABC transporter permease [Phytomonospora endophytica]